MYTLDTLKSHAAIYMYMYVMQILVHISHVLLGPACVMRLLIYIYIYVCEIGHSEHNA